MAEDLLPEYASKWMPAFETLKYVGVFFFKRILPICFGKIIWYTSINILIAQIYVPVLEDNGHWYLMVASMDDCAVYLVDSYLNSKQTAARKKAITTIVCRPR